MDQDPPFILMLWCPFIPITHTFESYNIPGIYLEFLTGNNDLLEPLGFQPK